MLYETGFVCGLPVKLCRQPAAEMLVFEIVTRYIVSFTYCAHFKWRFCWCVFSFQV